VDELANRFVRLALALDHHDQGYVDAYFGPPEWREQASGDLATIKAEADELVTDLDAENPSVRQRYLLRQVRALAFRADLVDGRTTDLDTEARGLFAADVPTYDEDHYRALVDEVDGLLPGDGPVAERHADYVERFVVPPDKVDGLAKLAIDECRRRTSRWIDLPEDEAFDLSFPRRGMGRAELLPRRIPQQDRAQPRLIHCGSTASSTWRGTRATRATTSPVC